MMTGPIPSQESYPLSVQDYIYIDNDAALRNLAEQLADTAWLAIDTEFERETTYYPELCLLQIANADVVAIVDPFSLTEKEPLHALLYNPSITKVFHSARQDLEIFFHLHGTVPTPLFDTQIAAGKYGYDNGIGYANLVEKMFGVILDKTHTRTRWKRRPLNTEQLRYAADDVIYLGQIYEQMVSKPEYPSLKKLLQVEFNKLTDPQLYLPDPARMWQKIHEARRLSGNSLAALQALAAWRELTARKENQPRKWVLTDQILLEIARKLPVNEQELTQIKGLNDQQLIRYGIELLNIINGVPT